MKTLDLRSDTVTRPTPSMLQAMFDAPVGDDVLGDDPSVIALEAEAARLTGKADALFTPSGTMANQIAIRCWTRPGDEVIVEASAHPFHYESGGPAVISGVTLRPVPGTSGILDPETTWGQIKGGPTWVAPSTLLCVEDTANAGGGTVYPLETLDALGQGAWERGLRTHLDGARMFNAVVASGESAFRRSRHYESVTFCLSKGLGAPAGSVLCGPAAFIHEARRVRKMLGGAMRQAGYLAGAGLYALAHHVDRLADDHRRCRDLYDGLAAQGWDVDAPETNMLYVQGPDMGAVAAGLAEAGILCIAVSATSLRLVTHLDVDDAGIDRAVTTMATLR
jgi:threonine aldolase